MSAGDAAWRASKLRDAAALIVGCAELKSPLPGADGTPLGSLTLPLAQPLAALLLGAAVRLESGTAGDEPLRSVCEIASLVLHEDLGHTPPRAAL